MSASTWQPGQLLFVGFAGLQVPPDLRQRIREGRVGGVVLFKRNISDPKQLRALTRTLHELAPADAPLTIAIDQEGGRVQRLRDPWTEWPAMRTLGGQRPEDTAAFARALALELLDAGLDLDFAPVVDVDSNPDNPVIGDRSFARDPATVGRHAAAFITAMQERGVATCAKHFPGHGDTDLDSHLALPRLELERDRLERTELPPFRAAIAAEVASIMTAHVLFPKLDPKRPATLSPEVMGMLRSELRYDGLVFSDDIEMKAVADHFSVEDRSLGVLRAGVDVILACSQADLRDEVLAKLERAPDDLLEHGLRRLAAFKQRYGKAVHVVPLTEVGPPFASHQALAERLRADVGSAQDQADPTERA
ncbi:beta-N-acetylhexosaminidase [Enhygromyxa salina]|uniref:Beta-hexosaminidase A n=1 Tax=Enhygromyxa salina TaxID=215803 RepID=A0A2S9YS99_9BACT|nr:beta-N-acetylhexosaminidase [Enhygromyxa salina]PRQ07985.1 Beta-hexosaminidase A precursor [Enhygromyxa salina]